MKKFWQKAEFAWSKDSVRYISTPSAATRSTLFYIQEIGRFKTFYPYYTEREHLNSYLIVYTLTGRGKLVYNNNTYVVGPNDLFFIDCKNYQRYEALKEEPWEILWLHLNGSAASGYYNQYAFKKSPVIPFHSTSEISGIINSMLNLQEKQGKTVRTEIICSKLIVDLLTEILLNISDLHMTNTTIPDYIINVQKEIEDSFQEKITLHVLSKKFAMNKYQLAKEFKQHTGFTPNEYLINRRINEAKDLLKNTDLPISEIAYEVGIENVSHFINLFKSREASTPLSFRKLWQNSNNS